MQEPVLVAQDGIEDVIALMVQETYCDKQNLKTCLFPVPPPEDELHVFAVHVNSPLRPLDPTTTLCLSVLKDETNDEPVPLRWIDPTISIQEGRLVKIEARCAITCGFGYVHMFTHCRLRRRLLDTPMYLDATDLERAKRAIKHMAILDGEPVNQTQPYIRLNASSGSGFSRYPSLKYEKSLQYVPRTSFLLKQASHDISEVESRREGNAEYIPIIRVYAAKMSVSMLVVISVFAMANSGIHLALWDSVFPTNLELKLWRLASLFMTCAIPFGWLLYLPSGLRWSVSPEHFPKLWATGRRLLSDNAMWLYEHMIQIFSLVMYAFVLARLFLLVESFLSLRYMPIGVYYIPNWLQLFPHI